MNVKSASARVANATLRRTGQPFWQDESYDHWVRSDRERGSIIRYIEYNPVTAGLVLEPEQWPWSSAGWQRTALPHTYPSLLPTAFSVTPQRSSPTPASC